MENFCSVSNNHSKNIRFGLFGILTLFALLFYSCDGTSIFASRPDREDYDPIYNDQLACRELIKVDEVTSYKNRDYGPYKWNSISRKFLYNSDDRFIDCEDRPLMQRAMQKMASYDKTYRYYRYEDDIYSHVYQNWRRATDYYIQYALYDRCESRKLFPDFKEFDAKFQETFGTLETEIEELKELRTLWLRQAMAVFDNLNDEECDYSELINDSPKEYQVWQIFKRTADIRDENLFGYKTGRHAGGTFVIAYFNENQKRISLKTIRWWDGIIINIKDHDIQSVTIDDLEKEHSLLTH